MIVGQRVALTAIRHAFEVLRQQQVKFAARLGRKALQLDRLG